MIALVVVALAVLVAASYGVMCLVRHALARAFGVRGIGVFAGKPSDAVPRRAVAAIVLGSVAATYALSASLFVANAVIGGELTSGTVVNVIPGRVAEAAGMRNGDRVLKIAGARVESWNALSTALHARVSQPTTVVVERAGAEVEIEVTPRDGKIGIASVPVRTEVPLSTALARGILSPIRTLVSFARVLGAVVAPREAELSGPIGIVASTAATRTSTIAAVLSVLANVSAFLFLPIGLISLRDLTGTRKSTKPIRDSRNGHE
ncbi:Intramembrane protease RasP/YluC, implicated in cell division based on FtsL cleavage [Minicystis rosea]|nr:Intramembrane protease RasP/YluC, implicated in cell division based on FtsL cleavage [Minicystis rosea]